MHMFFYNMRIEKTMVTYIKDLVHYLAFKLKCFSSPNEMTKVNVNYFYISLPFGQLNI